MKGRSGHRCPLFRIRLGLSCWSGKPRAVSYTPHSAPCRLHLPPSSLFSPTRQPWDGGHQMWLPRIWLLTPTLPPEGAYLDSFSWQRWQSLVMSYGKYPHLSPSTSEKETSTHNTEKKKQLHRIKIGTPLVPKRHAKDNSSLWINTVQRRKRLPFRVYWGSSTTSGFSAAPIFPGRLGLQECPHLCNFISWAHNYPTHPRHSKAFFFFFIKEELLSFQLELFPPKLRSVSKAPGALWMWSTKTLSIPIK